MKRVYLIRHGQTNANAEGYCQGPDEKLSPAGERQAWRLAERAVNLDFEKIIVSDYVRTMQTAQAILDRKPVPLETSSFFREERWPSSFTGESEHDETRKKFISDMEANADDPAWHLEDSENVTDIVARIKQGLSLLAADPAEAILVVSHGNYLKQLVGYLLLEGLGKCSEVVRFKYTLRTTNTGISVLTYDNERWRVLTWNDHAHFAE